MSERLLYLFDDVDNESVKPLIEKINKFNYEDDEKEKKEVGFKREVINLYINTRGGNVYDGLALCNIIKQSKTPIHTITTYAMSMGLPIAVSGHKRYCYEDSTFMYHDIRGWMGGTLEQIKQGTEQWDKLLVMINNTILDNSQLEVSKMKESIKTKSDWFLNAEEALDYGLVDEIIK